LAQQKLLLIGMKMHRRFEPSRPFISTHAIH
jgi:hypothetical protein